MKGPAFINPHKPAYLIESCGVTLDITHNREAAHECFRKSFGAHVRLLQRNGKHLQVIAEKYNT